MKKTPFQIVTEKHGGKDKLIERVATLVEKVVGRGEETKEELRKRLLGVSNAKLLRLERDLSGIESSWGGKDKLVDAYLELVRRGKDADYRRSLLARTPGDLLDLYRSTERRQKRAAAA